jgi:hypothetical protein
MAVRFGETRVRGALSSFQIEQCYAVGMEKVNLLEKFALFSDHFKPRVVGELNSQQVKVVKFAGPFVWHHHDVDP